MDNQTTPQPSVATTPIQTAQTSVPPVQPPIPSPIKNSDIPVPKPPKKSIFTKLLLVVLIIVILFGIGYIGIYGYLNAQIDKVTQKPTPTIQPSPTTNPDPTANWKTYKNEKIGYSFQYPSSFYIEESYHAAIGDCCYADIIDVGNNKLSELGNEGLNPSDPNVFIMQITYLYENDITLETVKKGAGDVFKIVDYPIGGIEGFKLVNRETGETVGDTVVVYKNKRLLFSQINKKSNYAYYFDQILSTFKFTDSISPTCTPRPACLDAIPRCLIPETADMCPPETTVCTQDAKQCPDGSYVSRSGPNCEFAACPTE